jgi:hypothetical protein
MQKLFMKLLLLTLTPFITQGAINTASGKLEFNSQNKLLLSAPVLRQKNLECSFKVYNGKTNKFEKLIKKYSKSSKNSILIEYQTKSFNWKLNITPKGKLFIINSELFNKTNKELWLEPVVVINLKTSGNTLFWNGFDSLKYINKTIARKSIKGEVESRFGASWAMPFPSTALKIGKHSVFIGHVLTDSVSYTSAKIAPVKNKCSELSYSIRSVASPNKSVSNRFIMGTASTEFGFMEGIVQRHYDSMPECWKVVVGQDNPYIWGAHGHYLCWKGKPDYEKQRRLYITMDWAYCPYKRSGDSVGKKEFWDYTPNSNFHTIRIAGRKLNFNKISREDFRKQRKELFQKYAKDFGFMFYAQVAGTWCEYNLAKKHYPDAINYDSEGGVRTILNSWSTVHDKEIRVFPLKTSFGKVLREDLITMYKELNLPGFAFDCSMPGANYRGPAIKKDIPGRAWDKNGVFIDQGVAIRKLADFVHNDIVKTDDPAKKPVLWSNGFIGGDYVMMECSFLSSHYQNWMPLRKFLMGPRPGCSHKHGFMLDQTIPNWRKKNQEFFKKAIPKLADYIIFNEFKMGLTDSYITQYGNPQITYCMPEVIEMMREGWQALIPAEFDSKNKIVYKARYGKKANTCLFFGNPYQDARKLDISISNSHLGNSNYLFVRKMRDKASTQNTVKGGKTLLKLTLKSRIPYLFEAVCGIKSDQNLNCTVSSSKDINKINYKIKFEGNKPFTTDISTRKIHLFSPATVSVNGKKVDLRNCLIPANATFELTYNSKRFMLNKTELTNFPFIDSDNNVSFKIITPQSPNKTELDVAKKINWYFKFCANKKIINPKSPMPDVKNIKTFPSIGNNIIVLVGNNRITGNNKIPWGISRTGNNLFIKAKNDLQARLMLTDMHHVMDTRFDYIFPFRGVMGLYKKHLKHFNMAGKYLPYKKYFENTARGNK